MSEVKEQERVVALDFESRYCANAQQVKNPAVREFLLVTSGDISVKTEQRVLRTVSSTIPIVELGREQPLHTQDSLYIFDKDCVSISFNNRIYGGTQQISYGPLISLPQQIYDTDLREDENPVSEPIDKSLLVGMNNDAVVNNILQQDTALRQIDRFPLFSLFSAMKPFDATDQRPVGQPRILANDTEIIVSLRELSLNAGSFEPFFATISLYDFKSKRRLTENYRTYLSTPQFLSKLHGRPTPPGLSNSGNTAKFKVFAPHSEIFLVVRIEKVLMGDTEVATGTYFKSNIKPKDAQKYSAFVESTLQKLGGLTQSFGLAILPLFKETGEPLYPALKRVSLDKIVRMNGDLSDENLFKQLKILLSDKDPSKLKLIPGTLSGEIGLLNQLISNQLSPSLVAIAPSDEKPDPANIVREIQEFHTDETGLHPQFEYVNNFYLYPVSLNMNNWSGKGSARNLSIEVYLKETDDQPTPNGALKIYGGAFEPDYIGKYNSTTFYHDVKPNFYDEIKISLPAKVSPKYHILFVINHVNVRPKESKKEKQESSLAPIAYAFLPLVKDDKFIPNGEHMLRTVYSLVPNYLSADAEYSMKFIEKNQKPNFFIRTQLVSSIYCHEEIVRNFFHEYDQNIDKSSLQTAIAGLKEIPPSIATKWFPTLIVSLVKVMIHHSQTTAMKAFQSLMFLVDSVSRLGGQKPVSDRNPALVSFVNHLFDTIKGMNLVHDAILNSWILSLEEKNPETCEIISRHCWFGFELLIKSIVIHLNAVGTLDETIPRSNRFSSEFSTQIAKLIALILDEVFSRSTISRVINENLALFLKDLLGLIDRGLIMDIIYLYVTKVPANLKYEFLRIICDYEHFVQINLPLPDRIDSIPELENTLWYRHFLIGVLADEVTKDIFKQQWGQTLMAVDTLYFLLLKHESDPRYQSPLAQTCIAGTYFIFVLKLINIFDQDKRCILEAPLEIQKKVMSCFLWTLKNMQRKALQQWWLLETQKRLVNFYTLVGNCLSVFEYCKTDSGSADIDLLQPQHRKNLGIDTLSDDPLQAYRATAKYSKKVLAQKLESLSETELYEKTKEQNLYREVSIICLDILMNFVNDYTIELRKQGSIFMERIVINLLFIMLKKRQSESFLNCLFSSIRTIVWTFPIPLFQDVNPYCGDLTYGVLRNCASFNKNVRSKASAIFYLFAKNNFLLLGNFSRMKLQATIAVSKLVGEGIAQDSAAFKDSLLSVSKQAAADPEVPQTFKQQATELTQRLFTVLKNSIKINEFSYDEEMTADLYYQISKGYIASPDLRAAWLQSLAQFHINNGNLEEAAQCKIHLASLISVYINHLKPSESVPVNPIQFQRAAPNSYSEMNIPKEAFEEEGICQSNTFTRQGLFSQLAEAVTFLKKISLFESCISIYRLLIDIHKENRNFAELSKVFADSENLCLEIETSNASNSRMFANHYLVGFYGKPFKELDGVQFIYREGQYVRLADITNKLKERYDKKFGKCTVYSGSIDKDQLNPEEASLRILSVKPYFDVEELNSKERQSPFERQFNIKRFIFETPLTTTGARYSEDITEQQKKKTILEVELSFPYVIKRLEVVKQSERILSPIQTSTELIEDRCQALHNELVSVPPNSKTLQIILQGSVLLQVNAGPLAIARTFLGNASPYPREDVMILVDCIKRFVDLCGEGIKLNKTLIGADQVSFHEQMNKGYYELRDEVIIILQTANLL